jgi:purine-binding chemotaxis protein CheW
VDGRETAAEVVAFQVEGRSYALPLEQVVEVLRMVAVTPVPDAPAWVAGVVNLRGKLIPMIDLRPRFGAAPTVPDPTHVFVVAQAGGRTAGVLADWVQDVVHVAGIATQRRQDAGGSDGVVAGLARSAAGVVVILDLERLLDEANAAVWGQGEPDTSDWGEGRDDFTPSSTAV